MNYMQDSSVTHKDEVRVAVGTALPGGCAWQQNETGGAKVGVFGEVEVSEKGFGA